MNSKNKAVQNAIQLEKVHMSRAADILSLCGVKSREELSEKDRESYDSHVSIAKEYTDLIDKAGPNARRQSKPMQPGSSTSAAAGLSDGGFSGIGEMLQALHRKDKNLGLDERLVGLQAAAIGNYSDSAGGFAIPEQFVAAAFEQNLVGPEVLLNLVDRVTMNSDEMNAPVFIDNTHATSPYGITWGVVGENSLIGDASVALRGVHMTAGKHGALFTVSNEWLADAHPQMAARLEQIFNSSMRWYIEHLLWTGDGVAKPLGVLNSGATLEIPKEAGQAADSLVTANILKMFARLLPGAESRAIWAANKTCLPWLATLTIDGGVASTPVGLLQQDATSPTKMSILGRPLHWSEHLPALGNAGDIVLVDPLSYVLGDRKQVTIDTSAHVKFAYDQTVFRALARFDGQPTMNTTFTPNNGDTCGAFVTVAAR